MELVPDYPSIRPNDYFWPTQRDRVDTVSASLQCAYSIFHNDFLGRILFKKLPKKWTFDLKMRILFKKLLKKQTFDKVRSQFKMRSVMTQIWYLTSDGTEIARLVFFNLNVGKPHI